MLENYFKSLYQRTMREAYALAQREIVSSLAGQDKILDCGAHNGDRFTTLNSLVGINKDCYFGIERSEGPVLEAQEKHLNVIQGDLNATLPYPDQVFQCVFGLSVLEHLINPCQYLQECYRVLKTGGKLVILTPNISTYFTALLILLGRMPSSGPHPDSSWLLKQQEIFKVSDKQLQHDVEAEYPVHRHMIVFSYRDLLQFVKLLHFKEVCGYGFGVYPFPNFMQPVLEKIDPWHCHQMVILARK